MKLTTYSRNFLDYVQPWMHALLVLYNKRQASWVMLKVATFEETQETEVKKD